MQSSLFPPALFCRVDMVLCMFKNSQLPTQPSAITRVGKYLSCNQILQKFVHKLLFAADWESYKPHYREYNKITFACYQFCRQEVKMKQEL